LSSSTRRPSPHRAAAVVQFPLDLNPAAFRTNPIVSSSLSGLYRSADGAWWETVETLFPPRSGSFETGLILQEPDLLFCVVLTLLDALHCSITFGMSSFPSASVPRQRGRSVIFFFFETILSQPQRLFPALSQHQRPARYLPALTLQHRFLPSLFGSSAFPLTERFSKTTSLPAL